MAPPCKAQHWLALWWVYLEGCWAERRAAECQKEEWGWQTPASPSGQGRGAGRPGPCPAYEAPGSAREPSHPGSSGWSYAGGRSPGWWYESDTSPWLQHARVYPALMVPILESRPQSRCVCCGPKGSALVAVSERSVWGKNGVFLQQCYSRQHWPGLVWPHPGQWHTWSRRPRLFSAGVLIPL